VYIFILCSSVEYTEVEVEWEQERLKCGEISPYFVVNAIKYLKQVLLSYYFNFNRTQFIFKIGPEAVALLNGEALRRDAGSAEFLMSWQSVVNSLSSVFERMPKYAWIMKQVTISINCI